MGIMNVPCRIRKKTGDIVKGNQPKPSNHCCPIVMGLYSLRSTAMQKPKRRSTLRRFFGSLYYRAKKRNEWRNPKSRFAQTHANERLPFIVATHQSVLLRQLKNVDMWMQLNKINNLHLAAKQLNGLLLKPGETFSYWRQIGEPTTKKGYLSGMILREGHVIAGVGGGLCQLSNLLYWMTLHTPLTITERWRHSYDVFPDAQRTLPFGSGATCSYPNIDLQITNTTNETYQLSLEFTSTHLVGTWLSTAPITTSYEIEEREPHLKHEIWGGYTRNNELWRITKNRSSNEYLGEEKIAENHAAMMYEPLLPSKTR